MNNAQINTLVFKSRIFRSPNNSTFVEGSSRLSQCTKNLRLEDCGTQTLSFQFGSRGISKVSTCPDTDCHLLVTLENARCWVWCFLKQNSDPTLASLGRTKHPNLWKWFALRSRGFWIPNMLASLFSTARGSSSVLLEISST